MIQHTMQTPPQDEGPLDAASQSLGEAFATGFAILRYAMIAMATAFLFSGWSNISEGEVAVRCRFGKLLGEPGRQVLKPGGPYFAWPMPIDEVIRVPTTVQRLSLDESFWFEVPPEQRGRKLDELTLQRAGLVPGKDGSLITGDQNIVHAKWTVMYQVQPENAAAFVRNITTAAKAERVVRCAAEQAIVQITARTAADEFIRGQIDRAAARRAIQQVLNRLDAGITITEVLLNHPTPPLAVRQAFLEVSQAESEKAQKIEAAEREWSKVHNEAAGPGHRALNLAIDAYEQYRRQGDPAAVELVEQAIDRLLDGGRADECLKPWLDAETDPAMKRAVSAAMTADRAGGAVSELINEARSYRTQVVAEVSSEARRFSSLMPMYRLTPLLVKERLWRDARQEILTGDVETFYLPDDGGKALLLEINRDPAVRMRREQEKYRRTAADDGGRR